MVTGGGTLNSTNGQIGTAVSKTTTGKAIGVTADNCSNRVKGQINVVDKANTFWSNGGVKFNGNVTNALMQTPTDNLYTSFCPVGMYEVDRL